MTALDGATIAAQVTQIVTGIAQSRWPHDLPEQRALGAELEECCEGLFAACEALSESARAVVCRRRRTAARRVARVGRGGGARFAASDRGWGDIVIALASAPRLR